MAQKYPTNLSQSPHRDKNLEFDVFHVEGDVSHLPAQRFHSHTKAETLAPQGPTLPRHIVDKRSGPVLEKLLRDARFSQQEALKKTRAIQANPVIHRAMTDAAGPQHARALIDAGSPDHLRVITDGTGPRQQQIISDGTGRVRNADDLTAAVWGDLIVKTQQAQKIALKQMRKLKDAQGPSFIRISNDAVGPIRMRQSRDHQGPVLDSTPDLSNSGLASQPDATALPGPIIKRDPEPGDLAERIRLAQLAQKHALDLLKSMQDAQGPSDTPEMTDVRLRIARAREAQTVAMARLREISDFAGPSDARKTTEADGPVKPRSLADGAGDADARHVTDVVGSAGKNTAPTSGPLILRQADSASGPSAAKYSSDAQGGSISHTMLDATGPADPRGLSDAEGPAIQKKYTDAEGPSDQRVIKDSIGPRFLRAIKDAFMPKRKSINVDTSTRTSQHSSTIAERIQKIRSDQIKVLEMLDKESKK